MTLNSAQDWADGIARTADADEQALIGHVFQLWGHGQTPAMDVQVKTDLGPQDFTSPALGQLFEGALESEVDGTDVHWLDICESVRPGGAKLLVQHCREIAGQASPDEALAAAILSGRKVRDRAAKSRMERHTEELLAELKSGKLSPEAMRSRLANSNEDALSRRDEFHSLPDIVGELLDEGFRKDQVIKVGVRAIDDMIGGLSRGDLTILAAATSHGKTSFALHVVRRAAQVACPVAVFSLEMGRHQVAASLAAQIQQVAARELQGRQALSSETRQKAEELVRAEGSLEWTKRIFVRDIPSLDVDQARHAVARAVRSKGCGLIVVDYLQLMKAPRSERRDLAIGEMTRALKSLAMAYRVPIVLLSQINREGSKLSPTETAHPPRKEHLRESGNIEQDASEILFLHGHRRSPRITDLEKGVLTGGEIDEALASEAPIYVDVILAKSRFSHLNSCVYRWDRKRGLFEEEDPLRPDRWSHDEEIARSHFGYMRGGRDDG